MRQILAAGVWLATLLVVAVIALVLVLFVAGPHSGLLPQPLEVLVIIVAWAAVLVLPILASRAVLRRFDRTRSAAPK